MTAYLMQAVSSTDGQLKTWITGTPDWSAASFPGPGSALNTALASKYEDELGVSYATMASLRAVAPVAGRIARTLGFYSIGDGGGGTWFGITGATPGTYVHDGGRVIVPAGGDGSACWFDADPGTERSFARWGARFDGATVDTTAVQAAINAAKANGLVLLAPAATTLVANLALGGGAKPWGIRGAGKSLTIFKRVSGGTVMNCSGSSVPFRLTDFTINVDKTTTPTGASHGKSFGLVSGCRVERVHVYDHAGTAGQFYDDGGTHRFSDNQFIDCSSDGNGSQCGFLHANMDRCGIVRCYSTGNTVSPGYAHQIKNVANDCFITDCSGDNSISGLAFGNDIAAAGVERCTVTGFTGSGFTGAGMITGYSKNCVISGLTVDMSSGDGFAIRSENDSGNSWANVAVKNVKGTRSAALFTGTSSDNYLEFTRIDNINTTGIVVEFGSSTTRNEVVLRRMTSPNVRQSGGVDRVDSEAKFNASFGNSYEHDGYPMIEYLTLASDAVSPRNAAGRLLLLAGELGAADNIATIDATYIGRQGREIAVKNQNSSPALTAVTTGNISLAGGVSFALDDRKDTISFRYVLDATKWVEIARANNG